MKSGRPQGAAASSGEGKPATKPGSRGGSRTAAAKAFAKNKYAGPKRPWTAEKPVIEKITNVNAPGEDGRPPQFLKPHPVKPKSAVNVTKAVPSRHRRSTEEYTFNQADDRIYDIFRNHDFADYPHAKRQQLTRFYQLLMENQKHQNFTRVLTLKDTAIKQFIDCLMVTRVCQLSYPLLDMGTGPGFPGIPLKIDAPEQRIILTEGVQKRVEFLKTVREDLKLPGLDIIGRNVGSDFLYPVYGVITRAVEDARNTLGNVVQCLQTGGRVYLMKGPNCEPEIQMALDAWGEYYTFERNIEYELPGTPHERRLLIFRKTKAGPEIDLDALNDKEDWSE